MSTDLKEYRGACHNTQCKSNTRIAFLLKQSRVAPNKGRTSPFPVSSHSVITDQANGNCVENPEVPEVPIGAVPVDKD